jgi:hypothetical protein
MSTFHAFACEAGQVGDADVHPTEPFGCVLSNDGFGAIPLKKSVLK